MMDNLKRMNSNESRFESLIQFRKNPLIFFEKQKITREAFCLDLLKDLYSDGIDIEYKNNLVLFLQEISLGSNFNLVEQIVGSLLNLYGILDKQRNKNSFKIHLLISITTILLACDMKEEISELIQHLKTLLLRKIYNDSEDACIISTSCKCLEEIELFYPGTLKSEINKILAACEKHKSPAFQSYVTLLSLCIKNIVSDKLISEDKSASIVVKNDLTSEIQIQPFVYYILDLIPNMNSVTSSRILRDFITIAQSSAELIALNFKLYIPSLIFSSEIHHVHLAFELYEIFGKELFSIQEEKLLINQLVCLCAHPSLTSNHRLLYLDWLNTYSKTKKDLVYKIDQIQLRTLLPQPFDDYLMQEKKSCLFSHLISSQIQENVAITFLNESISGLKKCAMLPGNIKAAISFFRTLYCYFSNHTNLMHANIYKMLIDMVKSSPYVSVYALDFLQCVKQEFNEKAFHEKTLTHLIEHILSISIKKFVENIEYYLPIIESAAQESSSVCKPHAILRLFQKFLKDDTYSIEDSWILGNEILSICRVFLKHHNTQVFYYDLAEVLSQVIKRFTDIDVKSRGKLYYSALTSLSASKVQALFDLQPYKKDADKSWTDFVTDKNSSLQAATYIHYLKKPIFRAIKYNTKKEYQIPPIYDLEKLSAPDVLDKYEKYLVNEDPYLEITLKIEYLEEVEENFINLYSIVITADSLPKCKTISEIEIPILKKDDLAKQDNYVSLKIFPMKPRPLTLFLKAYFTSNNGYSYCCNIPKINLEFEDIFLPLPLICEYSRKQEIFELLWAKFHHYVFNENTQEKYYQTSIQLKISTDYLSTLVEERWKPYLIGKTSESIYLIAIYLPPSNHILMKIQCINQVPFIYILLDEKNILPWLNFYLQHINQDEALNS